MDIDSIKSDPSQANEESFKEAGSLREGEQIKYPKPPSSSKKQIKKHIR
jgi:hypothetical protein